MAKDLLIGMDPEFFLKKGNTNVSAHDLLPGTKHKPYVCDGGAIQVDGTAVEFNIDPSSSYEEMYSNISKVMSQIREMIPNTHKFNIREAVNYDKKYFDSIPEYTKELGCEPDYNAYTGMANAAPVPVGTMRTAACHFHIGWTQGKNVDDPDHVFDAQEMVKILDISIGAYAHFWENRRSKRRQMYGKRGAHRIKPYGVEYRVLDNTVLNSPRALKWVYAQIEESYRSMIEGRYSKIKPLRTFRNGGGTDGSHFYQRG